MWSQPVSLHRLLRRTGTGRRGAAGRVRLEVVAGGGRRAAPGAAPAPAGAERRDAPAPLRVLIIEDNLDAAQMLHELLRLSGHEVQVAYTGPEGLQRAREFLPHVVLCDLGLPGLNGYEVAAALRSEPAVAHARLIALTGYNTAADQRRSREAGFELHLAKPVDLAMLEELLAATAATLS